MSGNSSNLKTFGKYFGTHPSQAGLLSSNKGNISHPKEQEETKASRSNSSLRTNKASNSNNKVKNKDLPGYSGDAFRYEGIVRTFQQHHSATRCVHGLAHRPLPELNLQWVKSPHEGFLDKIAGKLSLTIPSRTQIVARFSAPMPSNQLIVIWRKRFTLLAG
ncbi:hypothetical protein IG631_13010 [Alternaria alternata]|nr:hypothetical protein IG631_13010 [Alternaria alternata]